MVTEPEADSYPVFAVSVDDLDPRTDWSEISSRASSSAAPPGTVDQDTEAKLYLLETQVAVYLDADPETKVWILAPDRVGSVALDRRTVGDLLPGMFLLIRTEGGGGDLIEIVADKLLGDHARVLRELQREWKLRLRRLKEIHGTEWIVVQLGKLGSSIAHPVNVGNFISAHYIRPNKKSDSDAIMSLIGIADESDSVWEAMSTLQSAHQRAGMALRKVLLAKAQEVDGVELLRTGRANIELSAGQGGRMTAFRILEIAPHTEAIPSSRLNRPIEIDD